MDVSWCTTTTTTTMVRTTGLARVAFNFSPEKGRENEKRVSCEAKSSQQVTSGAHLGGGSSSARGRGVTDSGPL